MSCDLRRFTYPNLHNDKSRTIGDLASFGMGNSAGLFRIFLNPHDGASDIFRIPGSIQRSGGIWRTEFLHGLALNCLFQPMPRECGTGKTLKPPVISDSDMLQEHSDRHETKLTEGVCANIPVEFRNRPHCEASKPAGYFSEKQYEYTEHD
jgi:hypothetical protein